MAWVRTIKAFKDLDKKQLFKDVRESINNYEANDAIWELLTDDKLEDYDFIYRDQAICVNVKRKGMPIIDRNLTEEENEILQHTFFVMSENFIEELQQQYGPMIVTGRSGGYWGLKVDDKNLNKLVVAEISDELLEELYNRNINYFTERGEQYGIDYLIGDIEYGMIDDINGDPYKYLTIAPSQKLFSFKKDIEDVAKAWESMTFEEFINGGN